MAALAAPFGETLGLAGGAGPREQPEKSSRDAAINQRSRCIDNFPSVAAAIRFVNDRVDVVRNRSQRPVDENGIHRRRMRATEGVVAGDAWSVLKRQ